LAKQIGYTLIYNTAR